MLATPALVLACIPTGSTQPEPAAAPVTEDDEAIATRTALRALGLPPNTLPRMAQRTAQTYDPRRISVWLTAPDPELGEQASEVVVDVSFEPRVYVQSISWSGRLARRATTAPSVSEAYQKARACAARRFELWDEKHVVLVRTRAWDGVSAGRPGGHDVEFLWEAEKDGLRVGSCWIGLSGMPPLVDMYSAFISPEVGNTPPRLPALSCLPVVEGLCRAQDTIPAVVSGVRFGAHRRARKVSGPLWGFELWHMMDGYIARTGGGVDAESGTLAAPEEFRDHPDVVGAVEQIGDLPPEPQATRSAPHRVERDERQAIGAATEFLGLAADTLHPQVTWIEGWGSDPKACLTVDVAAAGDVPAHSVQMEVQAGEPYYVSRGQPPVPPGLARSEARLAGQPWQFAWDFAQHHFQPWPPTVVGESWRLLDDWGERFRYHTTDHLVRTGTWALVEVRGRVTGGRAFLYVTRYEARRAPKRSLGEMKVDLLEAVKVVRTEVNAQPGAIFLCSYGVPVLSHPASPTQNPAWEIRYLVGPGGPTPIVRWAAVDATNGSVIFLDHNEPDCCSLEAL
jgi:hypothetical protein